MSADRTWHARGAAVQMMARRAFCLQKRVERRCLSPVDDRQAEQNPGAGHGRRRISRGRRRRGEDRPLYQGLDAVLAGSAARARRGRPISWSSCSTTSASPISAAMARRLRRRRSTGSHRADCAILPSIPRRCARRRARPCSPGAITIPSASAALPISTAAIRAIAARSRARPAPLPRCCGRTAIATTCSANGTSRR